MADRPPVAAPAEITVELGARRYLIHIGADLVSSLGTLIAPLLSRPRLVIVSDSNVAPLYGDPVQAALQDAGIESHLITVPAGEATKSFGPFEALCEALLDARVERKDMLLALGGGMVGDLTGFAASVLRRGVDFIQMPTSLLAMIDSSVGGKTGINSKAGKNLIGAFHQPRSVIADLDLLRTLPTRELAAGYAEMVKYGLIDRPDFYTLLEREYRQLLDDDMRMLADCVGECCRAKAQIVAADEREGGKRALLNLGHTFGHALEVEADYDGDLLHGEAVACGMVLAFRLSERLGLCPQGRAARVAAHLKDAGLPVSIADCRVSSTPERLLERMMQDKKVEGGKLTLVLARDIGEAFLTNDVSADDLLAFLRDACSG